ncbi:hypothetical protein GCM10027189_28330 [Rufibacter soli]
MDSKGLKEDGRAGWIIGPRNTNNGGNALLNTYYSTHAHHPPTPFKGDGMRILYQTKI